MPLNWAIALVKPMPMPEATVPSSARIRSGQMTGKADPAQEIATIRQRYFTTVFLTTTRMI